MTDQLVAQARNRLLHPAWRRAMDEAMSLELALEIAEVLQEGIERDLILSTTIDDVPSMQMGLDIIEAAAPLILSIAPTRIEYLASTSAHLAWILGRDDLALQRALLALSINRRNVIAIIVTTALTNPTKADGLKNRAIELRRQGLRALQEQVIPQRGLLAELLAQMHQRLLDQQQ